MKKSPSYTLSQQINTSFVVLLKRILIVLMVAVVASLIAVTFVEGIGTSFSSIFIVMVVISVAYFELRAGRIVRGLMVVNWGIWGTAILFVITVLGIRTPILFGIPGVIMATAWLQGRRIAMVMALVTIVVLVFVVIGEEMGFLVWAAHRTTLNYLIVYIPAILYAITFSITLDETFQTIYAEEKLLSEELHDRVEQLTLAQTKLSELNETLEMRVEERTEELHQANTNLLETIERLDKTRATLVQSEKLSALGFMVAGISHELNTPIGNANLAFTSLMHRLQQLEMHYRQGALSRSTVQTFFDEYQQSTELVSRSLEKTISLIAKFKEVASDQASEQRQTFRLLELVNDMLSLVRMQVDDEPWVVEVAIAPELTLDSYPVPLGQIISHLIANSLLHGFEGRLTGRIAISAVELVPEKMLELTVMDDGIGIKSDHLGVLFDPFFTTKLGQGSSGVGLYLTHRIITTLMGGQISVNSVVGQGTQFKIVMPLVSPVPMEK